MSCPQCGADIHRDGSGEDSVRNQAPVALKNGKQVGVDPCFAPFVQALNDGGFETAASCCGHGKCPPHVMLADERWVFIVPAYDAGKVLALWD